MISILKVLRVVILPLVQFAGSKTKASQAGLVLVALFWKSLRPSMADFVPSDWLVQRAYYGIWKRIQIFSFSGHSSLHRV